MLWPSLDLPLNFTVYLGLIRIRLLQLSILVFHHLYRIMLDMLIL